VIRDAPDGVVRGGRDGRNEPQAAILTVRVIPRAGNTAIAGTRDNALLVRLAAAPVDGAANAALVTLLAETIGVPRRQITVIAGEKSRTKHVKVIGVNAETVRRRLGLSA
jgi:uncharacterized protein (TIGR00251 family)